jgi:electron transfer flavoprotein alpha subunit
MRRFLALAEHRQGVLRDVSLEVLAAARSLPQAEGAAVLLGSGTQEMAERLARYTPRVLHLDHESHAHYEPTIWTSKLVDLVGREDVDVVVLPHSYHGMDLAGRLAGTLNWPLVTDVTRLSKGEDRLVASRMVFGGRVEAQVAIPADGPVILSVRPTAFPAPEELAAPGTVEAASTTQDVDGKLVGFLEYVEEASEDVDISQAEIVIAVGRGIGEEENLALVNDLADALGGVVACSRPIVDRGWLPRSRQVGTSGRSIRPKVYIAVGISGAFQHVAGMKGAGRVIAVNRDAHAPIFKAADYGIVGDLLEVVPELTKKVRERKG